MKNSIKTNSLARVTTKTALTAAGMGGVTIGAYHAKNFVRNATDNEILGIAAGIGTLLLGAVVVNSINKGVDNALKKKEPPRLVEIAHNDIKFKLDEGVGLVEQD